MGRFDESSQRHRRLFSYDWAKISSYNWNPRKLKRSISKIFIIQITLPQAPDQSTLQAFYSLWKFTTNWPSRNDPGFRAGLQRVLYLPLEESAWTPGCKGINRLIFIPYFRAQVLVNSDRNQPFKMIHQLPKANYFSSEQLGSVGSSPPQFHYFCFAAGLWWIGDPTTFFTSGKIFNLFLKIQNLLSNFHMPAIRPELFLGESRDAKATLKIPTMRLSESQHQRVPTRSVWTLTRVKTLRLGWNPIVARDCITAASLSMHYGLVLTRHDLVQISTV